jgi:glycine betaine catabolism B
VKTFRLAADQGGPLPFTYLAGQYLNLRLNLDGVMINRSYTIASSPDLIDGVEISVKRDPQGKVSRYLHDHVEVGTRIDVRAPSGKFVFASTNESSVILMAGGIGITPIMSILRDLKHKKWDGTIELVYCIRSEADFVFGKEIVSFLDQMPRLTLRLFLSQGQGSLELLGLSPNQSQVFVKTGRLTSVDLESMGSTLTKSQVFLCGPASMMDSMQSLLVSVGVSPQRITTEAFLSPQLVSDTGVVAGGSRPAVDSEIHFVRSQRRVDVEAEGTILEAAEQVRVGIGYECRSGICGQCKVKCLKGSVTMESRDALTHKESAEGWILACQAHATTQEVWIDA